MRLIYTRPDGGLSIVHAAPKGRLELVLGPLTDAEYEQHVIDRSVPPDAVNPRVLPQDFVVNPDRTFRNAWEDTGATIAVNMPKARDIHRDYLRRLRGPLLKQLDVEFMQAVERDSAADKARIAAQKQTLRDVTTDPAIEAASTPEEHKAVIPQVLRPTKV
jgi:hypothetical protein